MKQVQINILTTGDGETDSGYPIAYGWAQFTAEKDLLSEVLEGALENHYNDMVKLTYFPDAGTGSFLVLSASITKGDISVQYDDEWEAYLKEDQQA